LEEILFTSDIGVATTQELIDSVQEKVARKELKDPEKLKAALKEHMLSFLDVGVVEHPLPRPWRTLSHNGYRRKRCWEDHHHRKGSQSFQIRGERKVLLAAADTFRAAAVEQLTIWGERVGATVIKQGTGADPFGRCL